MAYLMKFLRSPLKTITAQLGMLQVVVEKRLISSFFASQRHYARWKHRRLAHLNRLSLPGSANETLVTFFTAQQMGAHVLEMIDPASRPFCEILKIPQSEAADADYFATWRRLAERSAGRWLVAVPDNFQLAPSFVRVLSHQDDDNAVLYWDEDVCASDGTYREQFFKPDWSPETWLAVDILRVCAFSRKVLLKMPKDQAITRLIPAMLLSGKPISHIPEVLTSAQSAVWEHDQSQTHLANVRAWLSAQDNQPESVFLMGNDHGQRWGKPVWPVIEQPVSIIIPTRNHLIDIQRTVSSLLEKSSYQNFEIILVDNGSTEAEVQSYYRALVSEHGHIRILPFDQPFNINKAWNLGAEAALGEVLLFLNNDVQIVEPGWMESLLRVLQIPGVGITGARLLYPDGAIQHNGIVTGLTGHGNHLWIGEHEVDHAPLGPHLALRNVAAVTGACLMVRRSLFDLLGGFDERYQLVFSDIEFCSRARRAGFRVAVVPEAVLIHYEGRSRGRRIPKSDALRASVDLLPEIAAGDPYYNANLSRALPHPVIKPDFEMSAQRRMLAITRYLQWGKPDD